MTFIRECQDRRMRILLVDSENSVLGTLYTWLENNACDIFIAGNGPEALTTFYRSSLLIDLLVTDCNPGGMTALDLAGACARRNPDLAVLYMSASYPNKEWRASLDIGRRAFLAKPSSRGELRRTIRDLLAPDFVSVAVPNFQPIAQMSFGGYK